MAQLEGVNIEKLQGGLQRLAIATDDHIAYIVAIPSTAMEVVNAVNNQTKGVVIKSPFEAELLGINAAFDANHSVDIHNQIIEFFRLAPTATLYLFNSFEKEALKTFINQNKEIKGFGLNQELEDKEALSKAVKDLQTIINELAKENRLIDFVHLGANGLKEFDLDLFELEAPQVSIFVACETDSKKVSIGSALGMQAVRKVSENLGSVDIEIKPRDKRGTVDYSLTDNLLNRWLKAYLSDGRDVSALNKTELNNIVDKGYIVVASYEGYPGFFFENSYTCIDRTSDFAFIENNRVWNKSARIIRSTLLPRVKSKVKKNPQTGFIASTTIGYWETLLNKALNQMMIDDDISGFEVVIDPNQTVNSTQPVRVRALVIADGIVHEFEVQLGLTNNI